MLRFNSKMLLLAAALLPAAALAQHSMTSMSDKGKPAAKTSDSKKMADAMSAAPPEISKGATLMDWPDKEGGQPRQLRAGTNGWVCFPSSPSEFGAAAGGDPMCLDKQWQAWADAWGSKKDPAVTGTGVAYMLKGDRGASNTDPFATGPAANNSWVVAPPHIMVLYQDLKMLDAFPTDPNSGGPWVMWKGTPYAHLMVPISQTKAAKTAPSK